jgi:predicted SAM-dependent methyltransferase
MALHSTKSHARQFRLKGGIERRGPAAAYIRGLLKKGKVLHLHASCGKVLLSGWLNFDLLDVISADGERTKLDHAYLATGHVYVKHDASRPYPIADGTVTSVYSEHYIEHLTLWEAHGWLRELHRLLKPGGVLRLSTPDLEQYVRGYLDQKQKLYDAWAGGLRAHGVDLLPRRTFRLNMLMREWGHQYLYDCGELTGLLAEVGFTEIRRCEYRVGTAHIAQHDQEWRRPGGLYIEAKKPRARAGATRP